MKLDDLVTKDASTFDADEWSCLMELGPLKGSLPALLVAGVPLSNGSVHLLFEYRPSVDHTFIGYRITRVWRSNGTDYIRTVRSDLWNPAKLIKATNTPVEIEVIINPEDWA